MRIHKKSTGTNSATLTVNANEADLAAIKHQVLQHLASTTKVSGFRQGNAPLNLVEKNTSPAILQSHFLEDAVEQL
jgi:FKBP-type peptidyl-prolyl cis-trans isomerase (trigger factor)